MNGGRLCPYSNYEISDGDYTCSPYGQNTGNSFKMNGTSGYYTISINSQSRRMEIHPISYTIAGVESFFGSDWDVTDTDNDMDYNSTTKGWYKTYSNVNIEAGQEIKFKIAKNHSWENAYPQQDYVLNITEAGNYDITINLDENNTVTATATKIPEVIYLFGSVGKSEAWLYSTSNPTLTTADGGETYTGVWDINEMPSYTARDGKYGLFLLATDIKSDWNSTKPYMIGNTDSGSDNHYWIDGGEKGHYGDELPTAAVGTSQNGWTLPSGTYEITYNRKNNTLKVVAYDGPVIFVYDYTRPYIYVRDNDGKEFNGADPGAPILNLDENVVKPVDDSILFKAESAFGTQEITVSIE